MGFDRVWGRGKARFKRRKCKHVFVVSGRACFDCQGLAKSRWNPHCIHHLQRDRSDHENRVVTQRIPTVP